MKRIATCRFGQLSVACEGEPVRVSVCHCLECQKRSGSAFATQARWTDTDVENTGKFKIWERVADSGHKATYQFCPECGSTLAYVIKGWPVVIAIPLAAFADLDFPTPNLCGHPQPNQQTFAKSWITKIATIMGGAAIPPSSIDRRSVSAMAVITPSRPSP